MKVATVLILIGTTAIVSAQSVSDYPACVLPCINQAIKDSGCSPTDTKCICDAPGVQTDVQSCIITTNTGCTAADIAKITQIAAEQCAGAGAASVSQAVSSAVASVTSAIASEVSSAVASVTSEIASEVSSIESEVGSRVSTALASVTSTASMKTNTSNTVTSTMASGTTMTTASPTGGAERSVVTGGLGILVALAAVFAGL